MGVVLIISAKHGHLNIYFLLEFVGQSFLIFKERLRHLCQVIDDGLLFIAELFVAEVGVEDGSGNEALDNRIHEASVADVRDSLYD